MGLALPPYREWIMTLREVEKYRSTPQVPVFELGNGVSSEITIPAKDIES